MLSLRNNLEEEKPPISERKMIIEKKTSLQMGGCEIVLEKGKEVAITIFDKTCTMKIMHVCEAVEVLEK